MRIALFTLIVAGLCGAPTGAAAGPDAGPEAAAEEPPLHQSHAPAAAFRGAPRPDRARNLVRDDRSAARHLLWVPRVILFPVKWTMWLAFAPARGGLYLFDRYQLAERFELVFFNDEKTFGIYPLAFAETGFGFNVGARMIHKDLFGKSERITARASYGGRYEQIYRARFRTGDRLGPRSQLRVELDFELEPTARFFGIGNLDEVDNDDPAVVPSSDPLALATRTAFQEDVFRARLGYAFRFDGRTTLALHARYRWYRFDAPGSSSRGADLDTVYDTDALIGWNNGIDTLSAELELIYDSRRAVDRWVWGKGTGWRIDAFAGYTRGIDGDDSRYFRYGLDAHRLINLYRGNRVLALRAYTEAVTGGLEDVPFVDLPRLGGPLLLRGYSRSRFRDRVLTLGTAEYQYPLARNVWAFAFVDCGRVFRRYRDFEFDDFRLGYGVGLQSHSHRQFQLRAHVASSMDGGLFFALAFDPVFETRSTQEQRR